MKKLSTKWARYSNIKQYDISNGVGVRISVFMSGCRRHCPGCFNEDTWDFNNGSMLDLSKILAIMKFMQQPYIDGLSILGGEPFEKENIETVEALMYVARTYLPQKDIWVWSGFTYDYLKEHYYEQLKMIDVLVDGAFELENRDITLRFRGSPNQRIIDVQKSLESNDIVLWSDGPIMGTH